jgi:hypothetical protein
VSQLPSAEKDAPERGHLLTITKSSDWHEDEPYWDWSVTCVAPDRCGGWQECGKKHEVDGTSATDGPYDGDCPGGHGVSTDRAGHLPWCDEDEFEFHGVWHTWRYGNGWTVPYPGCVVQTADIGEYADDIAREHGEGTYVVDDEWDDTSCYLTFVTRVTSPDGGPA